MFCSQVAANCTCIDKFAKLFIKFDTDNSGVLDTPELVWEAQPKIHAYTPFKTKLRDTQCCSDIFALDVCLYD